MTQSKKPKHTLSYCIFFFFEKKHTHTLHMDSIQEYSESYTDMKDTDQRFYCLHEASFQNQECESYRPEALDVGLN